MSERATATLTIRSVDPSVRDRLRVRAAQNGRSMEAELRHIVAAAVAEPPVQEEVNLAEAIHRLFAPLGGVKLDIPLRGPARELPTFEK